MKYRGIENYYRQSLFDFFSKAGSPFYDVTFHLDVTCLKAILDERGYSVYLNLCYLFTKAMQPMEDFRYRVVDGRIVLYDAVHMGMTVPASQGRFSFHYIDYDPDWERFNQDARADTYDDVSLEIQTHRNYAYYSALTGVYFTGLTQATSPVKTDAEPKICFGKFQEQGGKLMVPVGIQVNHIFIDGIHLNELVEGVQALFNDPA